MKRKKNNYFYTSKVKHLNLKPIMDVIDEFDINIIKRMKRYACMAYSAIAATLKYQIRWCTSASIV
jgi:hypothetical protein